MREIKFRGKRKCRDRWAYGGISIFENEATIFDSNCTFNSAYEVEIESIGQFTGSIDKNGVEIYEGDILKTERNTVEVFYGRKDFNVIFYGKKYIIEVSGWLVKNKRGEIDVLDTSFCDGEIIGNIYENPELLSIPTAVL